jgi:aminopeptidase N
LSQAATELNSKYDFKQWSETWLKTAGCNEIWHEIEEEDGKIKKFTVHQSVWKHGENNRLRQQIYLLAFLDD